MKNVLKNLSHLMNHREKVDGDGFAELVSKILADFPDVGWELGHVPDNPDVGLLSLSVLNSPEFLKGFGSVSADMKNGVDWKIEAGIPPRDWELFFEVNIDDTIFKIEGKDWAWSISDQTNFSELIFSPPSHLAQKISEKNLLEIGEVLIVGELGEINYLSSVKKFSVLPIRTTTPSWHSMSFLRAEFVRINPSCLYADWMIQNLHA